MAKQINVGIIGLDTSHSIEFSRRMQAPDCPAADKVEGLHVLACMRFETPFQDKKGLDARQKQLEGWGVHVTESFDEAVKGCDALMLEINDPAYHVEYFRKAVTLGKPIFLDKPLADTIAHGKEIVSLAARHTARVFSASSLRFSPQLEEACRKVPKPQLGYVYGSLGKAPAGSSIVWYGVHAFEMLERAMGRGAANVITRRGRLGAVVLVGYGDERRGVVELTEGSSYGGMLRTVKEGEPFAVDGSRIYTDELKKVQRFFATGETPVALEDTLEIMALLDAAEQSAQSGKEVAVAR
jgi:predicted dehydrogenase